MKKETIQRFLREALKKREEKSGGVAPSLAAIEKQEIEKQKELEEEEIFSLIQKEINSGRSNWLFYERAERRSC